MVVSVPAEHIKKADYEAEHDNHDAGNNGRDGPAERVAVERHCLDGVRWVRVKHTRHERQHERDNAHTGAAAQAHEHTHADHAVVGGAKAGCAAALNGHHCLLLHRRVVTELRLRLRLRLTVGHWKLRLKGRRIIIRRMRLR